MSGLTRGVHRHTPLQLRPPLDSTLCEYWHAEINIGLAAGVVQNWAGGRKSITPTQATAGNRPPYGPSAGFGRGRPCVQFAITGSKWLRVTGLTSGLLPVLGTRPYVITIGRFRSLDAVSNGQTIFDFTGASSAELMLRHLTTLFFKAAGPTAAIEVTGNNGAGQGPLPLTMHVLETWSDGTNLNLRFNRTNATFATALAIPADITAVNLGRGFNATDNPNYDMYYTAIHTAKPSEAYINSVRAWGNTLWGSPL